MGILRRVLWLVLIGLAAVVGMAIRQYYSGAL